MYHVYILECNDETLYTGITTDLDRRMEEHQTGVGAKYTRARGVKGVIYSEECADRSTAQQREAAIKKLSRSEKLALANM